MQMMAGIGISRTSRLNYQCKAELPKPIQFGEISVSCEGWDGPDDAFVLDGEACPLLRSEISSEFSHKDHVPTANGSCKGHR